MLTDEEFINGKTCPYCGAKTEYIDSKAFYAKSYGMVYACLPCNAWVGVHKGTDKALGRLANEELREWKKAAHASFDPLWKKLVQHGIQKNIARKACYTWLSNALNIPFGNTHIGMFDVKECKKTCDAIKILLQGEGLQTILHFDETVTVEEPIKSEANTKEKEGVDMQELDTNGKDKYLRDVFATLQAFADENQLEVKALQFTQFRISGGDKILDIYPVNRKYHNIKTNKRGNYGYLPKCLEREFIETK